jgi:hypothetical protein
MHEHGLALWRAYGCTYQGLLASERADAVSGLHLLRIGLGSAGGSEPPVLRLIRILMTESEDDGEMAAGLDVLEEEIESCETREERWMIAELLRVKGELLLMRSGPAATASAEDHFRQALDYARRQGALSWELRAATSLARLLRSHARSAEAGAVLQAVYDQFTEGFETTDLTAAKALLEAGCHVGSEASTETGHRPVSAYQDLARATALLSLLSR